MNRLLIMACSATKNPAAGTMPACNRYVGPVWQTYKAADPTRSMAHLAVLSARYGLIDGTQSIPDYNERMTQFRANELVMNGLFGRECGVPSYVWLRSMYRRFGEFTEVCIVGGHLYQDVAMQLVRDAQHTVTDNFGTRPPVISPNASIVQVCDQIGFMRQQLRAWLATATMQVAA
jgi:hypothetical protein